MKTILASFGIMAFILVWGFALERAMDGRLGDLMTELKIVEDGIDGGNWETASASANHATAMWKDSQALGSMLFHNQTLDNLTAALKQLERELKHRHERDSMRAVNHALSLVSMMRNSDDLSLGNLL